MDSATTSPGSTTQKLDDKEKAGAVVETTELDQARNEKFHSLSWQRLTVCLIVEAIALGSLSMPASFKTLGMVPGTVLTIAIGAIATACSLVIGETKFRFPHLMDYTQIGQALFGKFGKIYFAVSFILLLSLTTGSHVLTGVIALGNLSNEAVCGIVFSVVSMIVLYVLALPTNFHDMSILGFIDCASISAAILITMVASGVEARDSPGGLAGVNWKAFKTGDEAPTFAQAFLAVTNIVFAYAFAQCLPTMASQLRRPQDYKKSLITLGSIEIVIYTIVGAVIYAFKGEAVKSPSLLSTSSTVQKVAFGVALPVIFISGSINTTTAALYIHDSIFPKTSVHRLDAAQRTKRSYISWLGIVGGITLFAWLVAESIPSFSGILGLISALFISCFSYWAPGFMWFILLKNDEPWYSGSNLWKAIGSAASIFFGLIILVCGVYASADDLKTVFAAGTGHAWACKAS